jgi:tetratricopeptide (TPR) repeat protein
MIGKAQMALLCLLSFIFLSSPTYLPPNVREQVWHHRNLGKAYYENPMTQIKAVEEFQQALNLVPTSTRDRVNYGLALLRAGKTKEAMAELVKAQKEDPTIPHTWFNLGIAYKKEFDHQKAIEQLEGMIRLVENEPVTHYNLGIEYKLTGKADRALQQFVTASQLNPNFAAPHFQLYNAYREIGHKEEAARELELFNEVKKRKAGAAVAEDPEWSYYSEIYDVAALDSEFELEAASPIFKFQPRKIGSGLDPGSAGLAVIDFDGDGRPDLLAWSRNGVILLKNGTTPVANTGLEDLRDVISIAPGDFNNDGLPDLAVVTATGTLLYVNHNGKFENFPAKLPSGHFKKAVWMDYDHDYDLDLLLLGEQSVLLRNEGSAGFSNQTSRFPFVAGRVVDAATFELVPDNNEIDLAVQYEDGRIVIYQDQLLGHYEAKMLPKQIQGGSGIQAFDLNNDGWTDVLVTNSTGVRLFVNDHGKLVESSEMLKDHGAMIMADLANRSLADLVVNGTVYRNNGKGKFLQSATEALPNGVAIAEADFDGDGRTDFAVVTPEGNLELAKNDTTTSNHFLRVQLEGVKNLKLAQGAVVEVKAGAWYQKRVYSGVPLLFGLRDYAEIDTVRITWPNGLVQNETRQPVEKKLFCKEKPRLSGSCPMIFAWNGNKFEFITDVLGVAPLGASNGDGEFFPVSHREHIQIPGARLQVHDGYYQVRITEELREVSYLDKVQLIAMDHKAGEELFTNDKFKGPPFPPFRLFGAERKLYPRSATDQDGHNVLSRLLKRDARYVDTFSHNYSGMAELHYLDLDFGSVAPDNRAVLVLNGWVDWADGSTFMAAGQENKNGLIFPYLQVKDSTGHWKTVIEDMGIPSGKPKSIVVNLTGKFLSASREIRIVTNLCVYWDEIFLSEKIAAPAVKLTRLYPESADLRYRGFSHATIHPARTQPEAFDYEKWSPSTMWDPTPGLYTRYGEVRELLTQADDRLVIMGSGDELRLLFKAHGLPALASGWKRDFLLLVDGWAKDADSNTAYARTVEPLPFHGMSSYPYPHSQHFPDDEGHREYRRSYNTRPAITNLGSLRP